MSKEKLYAYLGFASKSRNLIAGYNTAVMAMAKGKVKLLIMAEDSSENTIDKMVQQCKKCNVKYRIFDTKYKLSRATGKDDKGIFAVKDSNFAKIICEEIDLIQSEKEVFK